MKEIDKAILDILEKDSRITPDTIAAMLGEDPAEIERIIKRLEKEKILLRYTAVINKEKAENCALALIEVKVTPQREYGFDNFAKRIYGFEEVISAFLVSGDYDYMLLVKGENIQQIANFVYEKLAVLDYVLSTSTHFILRNYKDHGVVLVEEEKQKRLVVSP